MNLVPVEHKDLVWNDCGQLVPPPGYLFIDLFRVIPFLATYPANGEGGLPPQPFSQRVNNNAKTLFVCSAVMVDTQTPFRIKWPNGRYFSQTPKKSESNTGTNFPDGSAGNGLALNAEQMVPAGGRITVEISGSSSDSGTISLEFWGALRYMVKIEDCGEEASACIVGYPAKGRNGREQVQKFLVDSPMEEYQKRPRYLCDAANIQANEVQLSNQCEDMLEENFTFFSETYTLDPNESSMNNAVIVPGADDLVLKEWRPIVSGTEGDTAEPTVAIRFPSGYSMTGGDLIPVTQLYWCPVFPSIRVRAGDRIIIDVSNINGTNGDDPVSLKIEFSATKKRVR